MRTLERNVLAALAAAVLATASAAAQELTIVGKKTRDGGAPQQAQKMMGGIAQAIDVRKGTGGRTVAGYSCQNWLITFGAMAKTESCVSTDLQYPPAAYEGYKNFMSTMAGAAGPMGKGMGEMYEKFKEMRGFPLASTTTVSIIGKAMVSSDEVTEIRKGAIPASAWELPAGYKKVDAGLKLPKK